MKTSDAVLLSFDLEFNTALKSVNLAGNSIGNAGAMSVCKALESNNTLEKLVFGEARGGVGYGNGISVEGAQALAKMLKVNRALKSVDLRYNSIPDEGCRQIRAAVGNKSIILQFEPQL